MDDKDTIEDKREENKNRGEEQSDRDESESQSGSAETSGKKAEKEEHQRSGILEKVFTVFSVILLVFMAGYLVVQIFQESTPPGFLVTPSEPRMRGDFMAVGVTMQNTGDRAAKQVHVRGKAPAGEGEPFEAVATLDWLPGNSSRHVTLLFPAEADLEALVVDVIGYEEP